MAVQETLDMNGVQFTLFADWKRYLLDQRDLSHPDGRALYLYRLSEIEFHDLEQLLRRYIEVLIPRFTLHQLARLPAFPELFVLYGAEWWRRRYDGSGFAWEPILRDLHADPDAWTPGYRSDCVRQGLRGWRVELRRDGGMRFLGSVAVQGGLPLKLLADARGGVGRVLSRVLRHAGEADVTPNDIQQWVRSLQGTLPQSYRQEAIFALLTDVAWAVLRLKDEAQLTADTDAVARLNERVPNWRDRFPMPLEDEFAQGLIDQLVRDAARVRAERQVTTLPVQRMIEADGGGEWTLRSTVQLPASVPAPQLGQLFGIDDEALPRAGELALIAGGTSRDVPIRRMVGSDSFRLGRQLWEVSGTDAAEEHLLRLTAADGRVWKAVATRGEALDLDLPWVFSIDGDAGHFLREGGGGVAVTEFLVAVPESWSLEPLDEGAADHVGSVRSLTRRVHRVRGAVLADDRDGAACRIRGGQAGAVEVGYEWVGSRYWLDFKKPRRAYRGRPALYRVDEEGTKRRVEGAVDWRAIGGTATVELIGPVWARYPAAGELKHRAQLVVLPETADVVLDAHDAISGAVRLCGWKGATARVDNEDVEASVVTEGDDLLIDMRAKLRARIPAQVDLEIRWPHTPAPVHVALPFPAKGVRAFDATGRELRNGSTLATRQLPGTRIVVLRSNDRGRVSLEIGPSHGQPARVRALETLPGAYSLEIRVQDHAVDVLHVLSMDDRPDATALVVLRIGGIEQFRLSVARYAAALARDDESVCLNAGDADEIPLEELAALPVCAMRLDHPGDESIPLDPRTSEGVATGAWRFAPAHREAGTWLIFPGPQAAVPFRPTVWPVPGESNALTALTGAIQVSSEAERAEALDRVVDDMGRDLEDPSWDQLEQLAAQTGHLQLPTLDAWRVFARSPHGMAAMALRFGGLTFEFVDRFSRELPFGWECVPMRVWTDALRQLHRQCLDLYGAQSGAVVFSAHLDARVKALSSAHPALAFVLGIATAAFDSGAAQHVAALKYLGISGGEKLFVGEDCRLMALRRAHAEDEWPTDGYTIVQQAQARPEVAPLLCPEAFGYPDAVINIPIALAVHVALGETDDWFMRPAWVHHTRSCRAFDSEWFDEAYNLTIARCLAQGITSE